MENEKLTIGKTALKSGSFICLAMIVYFMLMKVAGLVDVPELRLLNILIMMTGVAITIRSFNNKSQRHIQYFEGLSLGFSTVMVATVLFSIFIGIYLYVIDPTLLEDIRANAPVMGKYLTPVSAIVSVIVEGVISGLVISFIAMQYFKDDSLHSAFRKQGDHLKPEKE